MRLLLFILFVFAGFPALAEPPDRACTTTKWGHQECIRWEHFVHDTCQLIEVVTERHGLDRGFFTRLIWQESRFDPFAKSHANAMGIAQFIRSTATKRGLKNPYNPADALEHSAQYLAEMTKKYGNVGLAAVGYNGGERRAEGLIAGTGGLAKETVNYVKIITGASAETWVKEPPEDLDLTLSNKTKSREACYALAKKRKLSPPPQTEPAIKPWGVQLAFGVSRSAAQAKYKARTARCRGLLKGETPDYLHEKSRASRSKGYYFARIGRNSSKTGWQLCTKLKAAGCLCAVYRNKL
ncbi:lytic transglycosylase domain-containing protein [Lentibacter algarum]|uniref:lytic transglycosylase domain-containing protein n=1 Tax=Lentibacter algarum TaxID=576131 RepID=UPI001C095284|nr:lytic transglycosylase domain-containing protein [Lentibacter algarum]MBU2983479.1 lytic transglycosylase domain-containing protein [Lentibacter algarum]